MGGGPGPGGPDESWSSRSSGSLVEISRVQTRMTDGGSESGLHDDSSEIPGYTLLWSKSKVFTHPTGLSRDNIPGFAAILLKPAPLNPKASVILVAWIPEALIESNGESEKFVKVELDAAENSDVTSSVMVSASLPDEVGTKPKSSQHAFAVPLSSIYSLQVEKPTISSWHGSITINMFGGASLAALYFHDDLSASTVFARDIRERKKSSTDLSGYSLTKTLSADNRLPYSWGGEAFVAKLRAHAKIVRSTLQPCLYLVNPSRADMEVHSTVMYADLDDEPVPGRSAKLDARRSSAPARSILHESMSPSGSNARRGSKQVDNAQMDELTFKVLNTFSRISRSAKKVAEQAATNIAKPLLSHNLAKPILPHLPPPVQSFVHSDSPEFAKWQETSGTHDYNQASVFLAKWAKVVSEEGERLRREEIGASADGEEASALGAWEVLAGTYSIERPRTTRVVGQPIILSEWRAWYGYTSDTSTSARLLISEEEAKRRIFQRGLASDARTEVWPYLLGIFPWDASASDRQRIRQEKAKAYEELKNQWASDTALQETEAFVEENHRIEIDCRRTDRTQSFFSEPPEEEEEDDGGEVSPTLSRTSSRADYQGGQSPSNHHVRKLQEILMTYDRWEKELGYVQGMSDLCSPIYILMKADPSLTFWCFVAIMERMKPNFLRDQSGMKTQLSSLQRLIAVMDPKLYVFFEKTDSMNLFFCFRWILICFKREFPLEDVLRIWENLLTNVCGRHFHLFIALAILQAHRDVIMRYLNSFDEVLKYVNELSMTMDAEPMLCQAEILYRTLALIVDREKKEESYTKDLLDNANPSAAGLQQRKSVNPVAPKLSRRRTMSVDDAICELLK